jgi:hypothetical protein
MKGTRAIFLLSALAAAPRTRGESAWAYVPASPDVRSLPSISIPDPASEAAVRLIGDGSAAKVPAAEPRPVFSADIPSRDASSADEPVHTEGWSIPEGASWPDSGGRIVAVLPPAGAAPSEPGIRNPWSLRARVKAAQSETVFACGGIVMGGKGGPIAFINGHVVRQGDSLGRFRVARILGSSVVLGRSGLFLVLPMGRSTAVVTVGG